MSFRLGLTGLIGMGKTTTANMFAAEGIPVWDADATVHDLYAPGQKGTNAIARMFPTVIAPDSGVDRAKLRALIQADPSVLDRVNAAIHPLVAENRTAFLVTHAADPIVVLDIPLLYETGLQKLCDAVAVVSAPAGVQKARVLQRGMTNDELQMILARQIPDREKQALADYVIQTIDLDSARAAVKDVLADIRRRIAKDA